MVRHVRPLDDHCSISLRRGRADLDSESPGELLKERTHPLYKKRNIGKWTHCFVKTKEKKEA